MTILKPLAFLSLPIMGTLMLLNFGFAKPLAKSKIAKDVMTHKVLIVRN